MVDTIERAMYPLSIVFFLFGSGVLRYPLHQPRLFVSFFYALSMWSVYAFALRYIMNSWPMVFADFLTTFTLVTSLLVAIMSMLINTLKNKNFRLCIRKLGIVDDTLKKLGTPKEYHETRNTVKRMLIILFSLLSVTLITDSIMSIEMLKDRKGMTVPLVMHYPLRINILMDALFIFLLRYIGTRFDKINEHIRRLSETEGCGLRYNWKKSPIVIRRFAGSNENCKHALWITIHLHSELCRIAYEINNIFGIQLTIEMMSFFVIIISMSYMEYRMLFCSIQTYTGKIVLPKYVLFANIWVVTYLTILISLNHTCESVSTKARETRAIYHNLTNLVRFANTREEIFQFILQITLRPLQFSGMGMFCFGYAFTRTFLLWIVNTIIFLIQMNTRSEAGILFCERNNATHSRTS